MRSTSVVVAVVLVLAGCSAPIAPGAPDSTATPASEQGSTADGDETTQPTADNPWGKETLTVTVANTASPWRNVSGLVAQSLTYWERHDETYADYEVDFELAPSGADPDIIVRYVEDISVCGSANYDKGAGFASQISASNPPEPPEAICVRAGYTDRDTRRIVDHEFGHVLGIGHGEEPLPLMNPDYEYLTVPRPSREIRSFSPPRDPLVVYADYEEIHARQEYQAQRQLEHVIAYYERGAAGTLEENVTVAMTDNRSAADVVITYPRFSPCGAEEVWGTCGRLVEGPGDRQQLEIALTGVHEDTIGWHLGFWLGYALDADRHRDLAPPFRNATFEDRLSTWWEDSAATATRTTGE